MLRGLLLSLFAWGPERLLDQVLGRLPGAAATPYGQVVLNGPSGNSPKHDAFWSYEKDDNGDEDKGLPLTFNGLNTFAKIPFADCFAAGNDSDRRRTLYDIAFLGAPHDTTVTERPGARYGPSGIRKASQQKIFGYSILDKQTRDSLHDWAKVVDCGDAPLPWLDNRAALKMLDRVHRLVSAGRPANSDRSTVPRIITLGGDHTTTLSALRSTKNRWGKVSVIHFDSHIDTWDPAVLGGDISKYAGINHGTFLHIAHEENLILNTSLHAGLRAPINRRKEDMNNDRRCGFSAITAPDLDKYGVDGIVEMIRKRVQDSRVYISVDIDVLDPAFAPATGTPEPGGWSSRELISILRNLEGLQVVGADVVEVAPVYDTVGETTCLAAAEVAHSLLDLMVFTPISPVGVS